MSETWRRFRRLTPPERTIVLEAIAALFTTWAGLRLFGFRHWKEFGERMVRAKSRDSFGVDGIAAKLAFAQKIACLELATERHLIFTVNCLERSMALFWLCRRRGIQATLRFGARKQDAQVEAHAWIEVAGNVVSGAGDNLLDFVAFDGPISFPETQIH